MEDGNKVKFFWDQSTFTEYNREWIQKYNIFDDNLINPIFWRQVRQVVKKDEEKTTDKSRLEKGLGQS